MEEKERKSDNREKHGLLKSGDVWISNLDQLVGSLSSSFFPLDNFLLRISCFEGEIMNSERCINWPEWILLQFFILKLSRTNNLFFYFFISRNLYTFPRFSLLLTNFS